MRKRVSCPSYAENTDLSVSHVCQRWNIPQCQGSQRLGWRTRRGIAHAHRLAHPPLGGAGHPTVAAKPGSRRTHTTLHTCSNLPEVPSCRQASAHIAAGQLPAHAFDTHCHSWTVGPLTVEGCIDTTANTVTGTVSLAGVPLDHFALNEQELTDTIGGSVAGFKAEATLTVTFADKKWAIAAEICAPIVGCADYATSHTW